MERRLKKSVLYSLVVGFFLLMIGMIYWIESSIFKNNMDEDDTIYVTKTILDEIVPVVGDTTKIIKPYVNEEVKIYKNFYKKDGSEEEQKKQEMIKNAAPELVAMAEQLKTMLSAFPENSPELLAIRQSPMYKQVAFLIEN